MNSKIKIGGVVFEVPAGSSASEQAQDDSRQRIASKPETPEALEETPYIYRPNDGFQSAVDEARAIASISSDQKPWVIKTWFILFVIGPLVYGQLFALALAQHRHGWDWVRAIAGANVLILPIWTLYYNIWRRRVKKEALPALTIFLFALTLACAAIVLLAKSDAPAVVSDAAVVEQLRSSGSDLSKPHSIEFYLYFPTESKAQWAARRLEYQGFHAAVSPPEAGIPEWRLLATRIMQPDPKELADLRAMLDDLAGSQGGVYDGWEAAIVR